jgi:hypothetical protein
VLQLGVFAFELRVLLPASRSPLLLARLVLDLQLLRLVLQLDQMIQLFLCFITVTVHRGTHPNVPNPVSQTCEHV